jgi:hypothetical protein
MNPVNRIHNNLNHYDVVHVVDDFLVMIVDNWNNKHELMVENQMMHSSVVMMVHY